MPGWVLGEKCPYLVRLDNNPRELLKRSRMEDIVRVRALQLFLGIIFGRKRESKEVTH